MLNDIEKAKGIAYGDTEVFALLLATHLDSPVDMKFSSVVKYVPDINRAYNSLGSEMIRQLALERLPNWCSPEPAAETGSITGGYVFGVNVSVDYFLFGPYFRAAQQ